MSNGFVFLKYFNAYKKQNKTPLQLLQNKLLVVVKECWQQSNINMYLQFEKFLWQSRMCESIVKY